MDDSPPDTARLAALARLGIQELGFPAVILDPGRRIVSWSAGCSLLLGYEPGEVEGSPLPAHLDPPDRETWKGLVETAHRSGLAKNVRLGFVAKDGRVLPLLATVKVLGTAPSKPEGYLLTLRRPIEEGNDAFREGAGPEALLRLERLSLVGQLASSFAHEIKSPLHVILSTAELLADAPGLSPDARESLEMVARNAKRAAHTVRTLMDMAGAQEVELAGGSLGDLAERTLELIQWTFRSRRIDLRKEILQAPQVLMDGHHLQGAVYNLLANAVDAMPEGGALTLRVAPTEDGREVLLQVSDTGHGVPAQLVSRLGDPFFTTKGEGTGMGLFFTKQIAREHRARLEFDCRPGQGTTVTLAFPRSPEG